MANDCGVSMTPCGIDSNLVSLTGVCGPRNEMKQRNVANNDSLEFFVS